MADHDDVTVIQFVRGDGNGGARGRGVTEAQKAGLACLHCGGAESLRPFGWINGDHQAAMHSWCLDRWREG